MSPQEAKLHKILPRNARIHAHRHPDGSIDVYQTDILRMPDVDVEALRAAVGEGLLKERSTEEGDFFFFTGGRRCLPPEQRTYPYPISLYPEEYRALQAVGGKDAVSSLIRQLVRKHFNIARQRGHKV
jgi:hypothetical protein